MSLRKETVRPPTERAERRQSSFFTVMRPIINSGAEEKQNVDAEAVKSGYLYKRGGGKKSSAWKKRWFVLSGQNLYYYKNEKDRRPQGLIAPLREFTVEDSTDDFKTKIFEFKLVPKDSARVYFIYTASHDDKSNWLRVFNQACSGGSQNKRSVQIEEKLRQSSYDIPAQDLEWTNDEKDVLGKGASGIVRKGLWLKTTEVAIKYLNNLPEFIEAEETMQFFSEIETLSPLRHPNIVPMYGYCRKDGYLCLVTEFVKQGNLSDVIRDTTQRLSVRLRLDLLSSICRGMVYLHDRSIIHRDLKPGNILIENLQDAKVKVCDFGLSTFKVSTSDKETQQTFGTPQYAAPELSQPNHTTKVDVFSFAVIMWEMFARIRPWDFLERGSEMEARVAKGDRLPIPNDCPDHLRYLIQRCWDAVPDRRPPFESIYREIEILRNGIPKEEDQGYETESRSSTPLNDSGLHDSGNRSQQEENLAVISEEPAALERHPQEVILDVFRGEDSVTWLEMTLQLQRVYQAHEEIVEKIRPVVANVQKIVSRERWDDFVRWFNPLIPSENLYHSGPEISYTEGYEFGTVIEIVGGSYFLGFVNASEAREILENRPTGSFLFRFSSNPGAYALSVNYGQIGHWRITTDKARGTGAPTFKIDGKIYRSIEDIVWTHRVGGEPLQVKTNNITSSCYLKMPVDREEVLKPKEENHYDNLY